MKDPFLTPTVMKDPFLTQGLMKDPFITVGVTRPTDRWPGMPGPAS